MDSGIEQINSTPFLPILASPAPTPASTTHPTINISPASMHKPKPGDANGTFNAADDTVEMNGSDDTDEVSAGPGSQYHLQNNIEITVASPIFLIFLIESKMICS